MAFSRLELKSQLFIPDPGDPDSKALAFYTSYYGFNGRDGKNNVLENRDDSPDESRLSLLKRTHNFISSLSENNFVLDLGAGRQIFEAEYENLFRNRPACQIITVDIANIAQEQLLVQGYPHIQTTGRSLPFKNSVFDAAVSNMAFDFMLPEALPELFRVTKSGALVPDFRKNIISTHN